MWVETTTTTAHAAVVFRFAVGDSNPGMTPMRLESSMKNAKVPIMEK